jgi:hypothetical protein
MSCNGKSTNELFDNCYEQSRSKCEDQGGEIEEIEVLMDAKASSEACKCRVVCKYSPTQPRS